MSANGPGAVIPGRGLSPADATLSVGMAVALAALAMTFAAVLLAYAIVRVQAPSWPPAGEAGPPRPWPWPVVATLAAVAGSAMMARSQRVRARLPASADLEPTADDTRNARSLTRWLGATVAAGLAFVAIQASGWGWLTRTGFRPDSGLVASVVYALTVFHALHALAAVIVTAPLLARAVRHQGLRPSALAAVASFWHLVTAVWLVVFVAVFVA